jgi:hypothetical protein
MKEFNVGDLVWWATYKRDAIREKCPVCFGKCKVVLILGNDEQVEAPCNYCSRGMMPPTGFVEERYDWHSEVRQVTIEMKEVTEKNGYRDVEYSSAHYVLKAGDSCFSTKEEAEARVVELTAEQAIRDEERIAHHKENDHKSYSWHVGYHQRAAKKAKEDMEYHTKKAVAMKALSRPH